MGGTRRASVADAVELLVGVSESTTVGDVVCTLVGSEMNHAGVHIGWGSTELELRAILHGVLVSGGWKFDIYDRRGGASPQHENALFRALVRLLPFVKRN